MDATSFPAGAKRKPKWVSLSFFQRIISFPPVANSSVHRIDIGVAHFLQIVSRQGGAKSTSAIEYNFLSRSRHLLLDVALDDPLAQEHGFGQVILRPLAFLADIHQVKLIPSIQLRFDLIDGHFANARFGVLNDFQKTRGMLMGHSVTKLRGAIRLPADPAARRAA